MALAKPSDTVLQPSQATWHHPNPTLLILSISNSKKTTHNILEAQKVSGTQFYSSVFGVANWKQYCKTRTSESIQGHLLLGFHCNCDKLSVQPQKFWKCFAIVATVELFGRCYGRYTRTLLRPKHRERFVSVCFESIFLSRGLHYVPELWYSTSFIMISGYRWLEYLR